jgi:DNA-binding transcriptional regulator YdaS (Cro superfamily)
MAVRSPALQRAINSVGTARELARLLGITPQSVSQWKTVPVRRVLAVERITGVPRHHLCPELYPPPRA